MIRYSYSFLQPVSSRCFHAFFLLAVLFSSSSFHRPGSNTAFLKGVSATGKTVFYLEISDISGNLESAYFEIEGQKLEFTEEDEAHAVFSDKHGIYTILLKGRDKGRFMNGRYIEFFAIPSSFKIIPTKDGSRQYRFKAIIEGTEPRPGKGLRSPAIELHCTLDYSI